MEIVAKVAWNINVPASFSKSGSTREIHCIFHGVAGLIADFHKKYSATRLSFDLLDVEYFIYFLVVPLYHILLNYGHVM